MSATISDCGLFRYTLERKWALGGGRGTVLWVMLNPSTADAEIDDPTIGRCIGYAKSWGYDGIMVGNLFAYRATKPADLWDAGENIDIIGSENDGHLRRMAAAASIVVAAWGGVKCAPQVYHVTKLLTKYADVHCLGATKDGGPLHPLYKPKDLRPILYSSFQTITDAPK
jgi:hypothetical protein